MGKVKHIISLGAGVQSSTMALMAAQGEITPMPDAAIFADTQAEPQSVYRWLDWLEKQLPFPVYRVTAGSLTKRSLALRKTRDGRLYSKTDIPYYTKNRDGSQGKIPRRQCTRDFKLLPIMRKQRELAGVVRGQREASVIAWQGISLDEIYRMKESRERWCANRYPLVEAGIRRSDCLVWMRAHGYPSPPRSACIYCPYHNDVEWRRLKLEAPDEFAAAAEFESSLQQIKALSDNADSIPFLHKSCVPLREIDFASAEDRGQTNLFNNECEGMCGV